MSLIVIFAILVSIALYIYTGYFHSKDVKRLGDIIPIVKDTAAKVGSSTEFSSSTVATTISLATVIVAFFDLVGGLGYWLFWTVITTVFGLLLFSLITKKIWEKFTNYNHRPTLHEFLGLEFESRNVGTFAAIFTTIGYLSMFAIELTVGARFLAGMIPNFPEWLTVIIISAIAFTYTSMGGFRTVIVTDRFQMVFIWLLLAGLILFYAIHIASNGGFFINYSEIPENVRLITWDNGLLAFISGIFLMNLFTYVSNMGLWQRVAGSQEPKTIINGMWESVFKSMLSWSLFVIVAIGAFMVISPVENENLLITLSKSMSESNFGSLILFFVVLGLYGAMLSTASTQLIAVSHTIYEDILSPFRNKSLQERVNSKVELRLSRRILVFSALIAVIIVEMLRIGGFTVADLAFAVYGAALSLVPPIMFALYSNKTELKKLKIWATISILGGFLAGWGIAIYGKVIGDGNLVFLAPCFSIGTSAIIMFAGYLFRPQKNNF